MNVIDDEKLKAVIDEGIDRASSMMTPILNEMEAIRLEMVAWRAEFAAWRAQIAKFPVEWKP